MRRGSPSPIGGGAGLQQPGGLSRLRRNGDCAHGGRIYSGPGRVASHRRGGGSPVADPDVVADEGHRPGDGSAHRRPLPGTDGGGAGHRVPRARGQKEHHLSEQDQRRGGGYGFYLLQRHLHRGKRPVQGEGREGHEACREVFKAGRLPRLRRYPAVRDGKSAEAAGTLSGRGLPDAAGPAGGMGGRGARLPAG